LDPPSNLASPVDGDQLNLPPLFPGPALIIMGAAFAMVFPFFFLGNPSGHDFEFHVLSWMEVVNQWKQGVLYPRWAECAHYTYGEARFLFYPPTSWSLGALIGTLLPWKVASGAYVWCALTASGTSMFLLARRYLCRSDAIFAAVLYATNPYYVVVVYWRSALAELLAGCLLPLLLLIILRHQDDGRRMVVPLSLVVAAAWLTNAPSAVMVNYSLALLVVVSAVMFRRPKLILYGGLAVALGAALAGFYLIPAAYEEKWVNIAEVLGPGLRPQDNFFFTLINDADHNRFNLAVSIVGAAEVALFAAATFLTRRWRREWREEWWMLIVWGTGATLLMLPITLIFWEHLPKLRFVQLPWRWLLCLSVAFAMLVTAAFRRWLTRAAIYLAMFLVLWVVWHRVQPPWWDKAADIQELHDFIEDGEGYEGTDEYVPVGVDASDVNKNAPRVATTSGGSVRVKIQTWSAETKTFATESAAPENLRLRLFNYPAWRVEVNEKSVMIRSQPGTGEIVVPVSAGANRVRVHFEQTRDRFIGGLCSAIAALLILVWQFGIRRRKTAETDATVVVGTARP
jgi:6-pyruvoyl-tetrahydropterin synthase related domain